MQFLWDLYHKVMVGKHERKEIERLKQLGSSGVKQEAMEAIEERKSKKIANIPLLVTIKNGVVDEAVIAEDGQHVEQLFIQECSLYGRETNSDELANGYVELEDVTICITWAFPPKEKPAFPKEGHFYLINFKPADAPDYTYYTGIAKFEYHIPKQKNLGVYLIDDGGEATFHDSDIVTEHMEMTDEKFDEIVKERRSREE